MSMWESKTLGDLCSFQAGGAFPRSEQGHVSGDYPFIKVSDMTLPANSKRIVEANNWVSIDAAERMRLKLVPAGAVAFAKIGEGLKAERLRQITRATAMDNNMMAAVPKPGKVDERFLLYLIESVNIASWAQGSALPYLSQTVLSEIPVRVPDLPEQRAIAATLGALDDKIESNRRTVALIPQLVRARVDASISQAGDRIAVAELAHFVNGGAYTKVATGTGRMVIRIAELNSGPGGSTVYNDIDVPDEKVARAGDILMSWSGSLGVYRWFRDEAIVNQHIFKVIPTGYPAWLVFDRLDAVMPIFRGVAADKATTMGHIQRGHLESTNVEIPVVSEIEQLNEMLSPLWGRLLSAEREVVRLTKLRDALLPELLSGRMRVPAEGVAA
ncbi:hypothetical protein HJG43_07750 [Kineosporiaceae bacterium SCSIO 59966]|nr:hypothetical protein HJG43_07750 [Kineosporiaceae bacterium SCSIO 59966]